MIVISGFSAVLLGRGLHAFPLAIWLIVSTGLLAIRFWVASWAQHLDATSSFQLDKADRLFRAISIASQVVIGAGIWIALMSSDVIASYLMTLAICLYAVGCMINLAHDYRSALYSIPLLMGQPFAFWLHFGREGVPVAIILAVLTLLMITAVRNTQTSFNDSIKIRFEKDQLLKEIESISRSKAFFMAAASHDLRQPLYAASILNDALALHEHAPESARLLAQQGRALATASNLFDNLLDLSRFESGVISPVLSAISLSELAADIQGEFAPQCAAKGLRLEVTTSSYTVTSDYDLLTRLVRNLLSNAVRYTHAGTVRLNAKYEDNSIVLSVEDSGVGIAPADQERVFLEFVHLDNPQRAREKGVGLGLAIVRHIAMLLGHELSLSSSPGQGTVVSLRLPMAASAPMGTSDSSAADPPVVDVHGQSVLIVESDVLVSEALHAYFIARGCKCQSAQSRIDIVELEKSNFLPDIVVLDDMLGAGESGLALAHWLTTRIDSRRILLTTGNAEQTRWRELTASGFAVLRKPVSAAEMNRWLSVVSA
jgi:signal transduction histidine kinase/CheY-like chemotaxis protein